MKHLIYCVLAITAMASNTALACDTSTRRLIENEAKQSSVHSAYAVAVARTLTRCRTDFRDRSGRVGVMGVRKDLLPDEISRDPSWLNYPTVNVNAALTLLTELLELHGDWETALTVYYQGNANATRASRRWVAAVFRDAHPITLPREPQPWRQWRPHPGDLDDFGPRKQGDWVPIHRYRPSAT